MYENETDETYIYIYFVYPYLNAIWLVEEKLKRLYTYICSTYSFIFIIFSLHTTTMANAADAFLLREILQVNVDLNKRLNKTQKERDDMRSMMNDMTEGGKCLRRKIEHLEGRVKDLQEANDTMENTHRSMQEKIRDMLKTKCTDEEPSPNLPASEDPIESFEADSSFIQEVEFHRIAQKVWSDFKPSKADNEKYLKAEGVDIGRSNKRLRGWVMKDTTAVKRLGVREEWKTFFKTQSPTMFKKYF